MKRKFTLLLAAFALLATVFLPLRTVGQTWTREESVLKTLTFPDNNHENNGLTSNQYQSTWTAMMGIDSWTISNFNNNNWNNNWTFIKCGRKNNASVGTIITSNAFSDAISKVVVTIDACNASKVNSQKLYVATNADFTSNLQTIAVDIATGENTFTIPTPTANCYYKLEYDCQAGSSNGLVTISKVDYYGNSGGSTTPTINASDVNIAYDATSGSIPYSISNPTSATLSATTTASWVSNIAVTNTAVTFTTTQNTTSSARTATFTLSYTGATSKTVTVTQAAAPVVYTTIPDLFAAATSTATPVNVQFGNWVVSAVKGSNAYLTDNTGNGLIIYHSGHGFQVNDMLSGTASCNLLLYRGSAELTGLTSASTGLTVTPNGNVTEQNIAINTLTGVNTGALLSYTELTYNGTELVDADNNAITPYSTLYAGTFENGKKYNVKGIYLQYNTTKEILPRSAADIEEVTPADPELTVSVTELSDFTYTFGNGPSAAKNFTVSGSNLTANVTVTAPTNFQVCATATGNFANSLTLTQSAGTLNTTTVYVKMIAGLAVGSYSGDLTIASTGATSKTVALSGTVDSMPVVETPTFTPAEGTYTEAQNVTIACSTEGATIRYTLDGSDPTSNSTAYNSAITINATTTVKAKAFKSGCEDSEVATATYTIVPPAQETAYTLIKNANALVAGEKYIIVGIKSGEYKALGKQTANNRSAVDVSPVSDVITVTPATLAGEEAVYELTLGQENGHWTLYDAANGGYLYAASSSANYLKTQSTNNANGEWTIEIDGDGVATIKAQGSNTRNWLRLNNNGSPFACYASGQLDVYLYKSGDVPQLPTPTLTASVTSLSGYSYTENEGPSAAQSFTLSGGNLVENVTITAPTNFELCDTETGTYSATLTLTPTAGALDAVSVYVRLAAGLDSGNYTGSLTAVSGEASATVTLTGLVSAVPLTATPTFSLAEGSYMLEQTVSISCTTENATIYYTLDGTDPTENSSVYSEPISIPATTTLKAAAIADGYAMSEIATATYTIYEVMPIADARALANNAYACVEGTVIFIDGRNVYVQNGAAGIDLFLNSNTVPANLAIGDNVRAYGKKTVYNGLVELTGIKGNNDNEFAILSNGNELPLEVQTVAALNADFAADNLLQSTRVKIENAIIGAINLNGNTPITQDGESINIYRIPDVPGLLEGDRVTFTAIVSCYNAIQLRVVSIDDIEFSHNPKLTATPTALSGLTYEYEDGGPSELAQFLLSGDFLTDAAYIVPSESFEVSTFGGELFTPENPAMVSASAGHFNNLPIFVRLKAGLEVGEYNERLALATEGSDTTYVNVSGTVTGDAPTPPTPPVVEGNYVRISDLSQLTDGSMVIIASRYNATANAYEAAANTLTSGKMTYTAFVSATDTNNNEILPAAIADAENYYYWTVGVNGTNYTFTNANGDVLSYNSGTNFNFTSDKTDWTIVAATSEESALVPNYGGFCITNVDSDTRGIALRYNSEQNFNVFGAYSTSNISNSYAGEYNFFLDLFVKTEGGDPPTPPTPVVATPTFSPEAGTYYEPQTVTISCTTEGATIYYSTDSENGPWTAYTEAIAVEQSTTLWAYAEMDGYDNSAVAQAEYLIEDAPVPPTPTEGDYVRIFDLSELTDGSQVIIASRYNATANAYEAAANTLTNNKLNVTAFVSTTNGDGVEILPASIADAENDYYWTVGVNGTNYTFTNANGDVIGYTSGTNFNMNGENTDWTIEYLTSEESALVPNYSGFVVTNVSTIGASTVRAFALQLNDNGDRIAPYSKSNMNSATYNFFLDFFVKGGEGGDAPTPTLAAPVFTPAGGTYYEAQEVTISCSTEGATIYYSTESENGPWTEYEDAISVTEDMTIWAYAEMEGYNNSPVASATYVINTDQYIIFNQDWENDWHGWTQVSVEGDAEWIINSYQGNHYGYMNGYSEGSAHQNEDWLISPAFDLDAYTDVVLTFRTAKNYNGDDIEVFFSNDYDGTNPNAATWQTINCPLSTGSWNWVESGAISMDGFSGNNCYIAFKYTSSDEQAAGWEVDDIMLVSGSEGIPSITATPNTFDFEYLFGQGPSASRSYILTSENLEGQGNVSVTASEYFEVSLDNATFGSTITLEFANGIITNQPLTVYVRMAAGLEAGTYAGTITHTGGGASATVSLTGIVIGEGEPYIESIVPMYIQGNNGSNNNRVPVATQVFVYNLAPNTTYRYTNQFVDGNDGSETAGAGNVIYANANGFYRSTSPSLATEGGYGEFTTNEEGNAMLWCVNEPTANARFTPGNQVYLRLRINDGNDGTSVAHVFTTTDAATVLNFGTDRDAYQGTAFYAKSHEDAMSFAALYATASDPRPLYSTSIETVGVDYGSINQYANFYKDLVAGNDGWFGGILPNDSEDGINHIAIIGMDGNILNEYNTSNGFWQPEGNTVNPNGGLDTPIFIDLTYTSVDEDEEANVTIWNTGNEFVIENGSDAHYTMTVYSLLGQSMMQRQINAGSTERVSHSLAKGLYVIHLQNNRNTVSAKVIVR